MIVIAVCFFFSALSLFLTAQFLIGLSLTALAGILFKLGSVMLLMSLYLLFITGVMQIVTFSTRSACRYFSTTQRLHRRLLFVQSDMDRHERLFHFQSLSVRYHHDQKKKQLVKANEEKHFQSLSKSVYRHLQSQKHNLTASDFKRLRQEHALHHLNVDRDSLLNLQQKISEWV